VRGGVANPTLQVSARLSLIVPPLSAAPNCRGWGNRSAQNAHNRSNPRQEAIRKTPTSWNFVIVHRQHEPFSHNMSLVGDADSVGVKPDR
jgi:hypothetical protein